MSLPPVRCATRCCAGRSRGSALRSAGSRKRLKPVLLFERPPDVGSGREHVVWSHKWTLVDHRRRPPLRGATCQQVEHRRIRCGDVQVSRSTVRYCGPKPGIGRRRRREDIEPQMSDWFVRGVKGVHGVRRQRGLREERAPPRHRRVGGSPPRCIDTEYGARAESVPLEVCGVDLGCSMVPRPARRITAQSLPGPRRRAFPPVPHPQCWTVHEHAVR